MTEKTITISADIGITAALALTDYAADQKAKGYFYTAGAVYRDAATVFEKLGRETLAEFWNGISKETYVAAETATKAAAFASEAAG